VEKIIKEPINIPMAKVIAAVNTPTSILTNVEKNTIGKISKKLNIPPPSP